MTEQTVAAEATPYSQLAKLLHWAVAGMIVLQYVLAELAELAGEEDAKFAQLALLANHKSVGITILMLAVVRLTWRALHPPPPLPKAMPGWQVVASHFTHWSLYLLLFALPVSGWLMSSATAYSVSWFNLFTLPDFVQPDEQLKDLLHEIHEVLATALFVFALVHILAALKHALVDRDGVLRRMTSSVALAVFVAIIVTGIFTLRPGGNKTTAGEITADQTQPGVPSAGELPPPSADSPSLANLPKWEIDYAASHIRFSTDQAGAAFEGEWLSWQADVHFQPDALAHSRAEVRVNTAEVNSNDADRDSTITGADFFAASEFPQSVFSTSTFTAGDQPGSYTAAGTITVKGLSVPVQFSFSLARNDSAGDGDGWVLTGNTTLDRLQMKVGTGDWADTSWVGQFVEVAVKVVFRADMND